MGNRTASAMINSRWINREGVHMDFWEILEEGGRETWDLVFHVPRHHSNHQASCIKNEAAL